MTLWADPVSYNYLKDDAISIQFTEGKEPLLFGDVHFIFKNKGMMYDS